MPLNFDYQLDDGGHVSIIGRDGAPYRALVSLSRPGDPRGDVVELTYSAPGVRAYSRVLYPEEVAYLAIAPPEADADELDTLARMAVGVIEHPHPLAYVRDAARARMSALRVLDEIENGN